jgi:hypothetical protein
MPTGIPVDHITIPPSGSPLQFSGWPGYRFGSWSLQSSPSWIGTPLVETQFAAACPSPSSSFATYAHTPWSALHLPAAQFAPTPGAGMVDGTEAAQSASVEQPTVASAPGPTWPPLEPPSLPEPPALSPLLHDPTLSAAAIASAPLIRNDL